MTALEAGVCGVNVFVFDSAPTGSEAGYHLGELSLRWFLIVLFLCDWSSPCWVQ